jgi:hypothetical protein
MPIRSALVALLSVLVIAGCRGRADGTGGGSKTGDANGSGGVGAPDTAARAARWQRDTGSDCGLVPAVAHANAGHLVEEYLARTGAGQFVKRDAWLDTAYECPHRLSVPKEFTVVGGSSITPFSRTDTTVAFLVESPALGVLTLGTGRAGGASYLARSGVVADTFVVTRTPYGWRIVTPLLPERVVATTVLADAAHFPLKASDRAALVRGMAAGAEAPSAQPQGP